MNFLQFQFAKFTKNERKLSVLSATQQAIYAELNGKTVAVVGNARSLSQAIHGTDIDAAEIVIRLNYSPLPDALSHGTRTSWIATSVPLRQSLLEARRPERVLWMTPRIKRLQWILVKRPGYFLNPRLNQENLAHEIMARPTTGLILLDLLRRSPVRQVHIYGFDFFSSLSLSGSRNASQLDHNFDAEKKWVQNLMFEDHRFKFHKSG